MRERKATVHRAILGLVSHLTEGLDLVDAIYEALPDKIKQAEFRKRHNKKPSSPNKAKLIWKHWRDIDPVQAAFNVVWEQMIEDRVYATISNLSKNPFSSSPGGGRDLQTTQQGDRDAQQPDAVGYFLRQVEAEARSRLGLSHPQSSGSTGQRSATRGSQTYQL